MRLRWIFCAQLWACSALAIEPGQGYGVKITWPGFVQQIESAEPVSLQYEVNACEKFTSEVRVHEADSALDDWHSVPVEVTAAGGHAYRATVDAMHLVSFKGGGCFA